MKRETVILAFVSPWSRVKRETVILAFVPPKPELTLVDKGTEKA